MRRVLALFFPTFSIDRMRRQSLASGARGPLLLVTTERGARKVAAGSPEACARGVEPGMSLAHARALLGDDGEGDGTLAIEEHDPEDDLRTLERLGVWAMRFSPVVAPDPPHGLLLDIAGGRRLFGEEHEQMERVALACEGLGFRVRAAIADTVGCAWALSRFGRQPRSVVASGGEREALAPLLVAALRIEAETVDGLFEVGIERIAQLFELRREELPARFRGDLLLRLDQALGNAFEGVQPLRHVAPLERVHVFEEPVKLGVALLVSERLLGELVRELVRREEGVRRVDLEWICAQAEPVLETVTLTRASHQLQHLWGLLEPRLEGAALGFGVERVTLTLAETAAIELRQVESWPARRGVERKRPALDRALGELLDHLITRLGPAGVRRVEAIESHLPEHAFRLRPCRGLEVARAQGGAGITPLARPSLFFAPPHPIAVDVEGGRPARFRWRGEAFEVARAFGPERIEAPWWKDERPTRRRDYFRIADTGGRWLWIARDGRSPANWFVCGEWA